MARQVAGIAPGVQSHQKHYDWRVGTVYFEKWFPSFIVSYILTHKTRFMPIISSLALYRRLNVYSPFCRLFCLTQSPNFLLQTLYRSFFKEVMYRYSVMVRYCRQNKNTMNHNISYLYTSKKPITQSEQTFYILLSFSLKYRPT